MVRRGAAAIGAEVPDEIVALIARRAGGDARTALSTIELAWETAQAEGAPLEERHVDDAARKRPLRYDKGADQHYDFVSAFIKSMRGSDPDAAVYYLASMLEGGEDPRFIARRMVIFASEDVGNADPRALQVAVAAAHALEHVGLPEAQLNLSQAAIYLANAPKSKASANAIWYAREDVRERRQPAAARDAPRRPLRRREEARPRRRATSTRTPTRAGFERRLPARGAEGTALLSPFGQRGGGGAWRRSRRGVRHRNSTSRSPARERVRLADFRGRRNVLLVFHPFAFTPVCEEEARDLQENLPSFESAETDVVLVSCDSAPARQAWKEHLELTYTLASDFWPHGEAAKAYGVFDESSGRRRPRHVPDRQGRRRRLEPRQRRRHAPQRARLGPAGLLAFLSLARYEWGDAEPAAARLPARRHQPRPALRAAGRAPGRPLPRRRARPARARRLAVGAAVEPRAARRRRPRRRAARPCRLARPLVRRARRLRDGCCGAGPRRAARAARPGDPAAAAARHCGGRERAS